MRLPEKNNPNGAFVNWHPNLSSNLAAKTAKFDGGFSICPPERRASRVPQQRE
jgi:hypothetical protein